MAIPVAVENEVIIGKSIRSEVCGMEMNASVVKAVTATLYDYKKEAVVREYSTNITDSHNDSGKRSLKGYIHVPTKMNPVIEFHDFGLGMSEDTIYSVYTVLGKSTKRGDNTTNGSLGFGSKSYGTVCDQMTVTSIKDGIKTVVICYKDRTGMLAADTKSVTETDQPNGTIVSIPVKPNEVHQWQETAAKVLGAFEVPHEVNTFGDYQDVFEETVKLCNTVREKGTVFNQKPTWLMNSLRSSKWVLMGDVIYTLPDFETLLPNLKVKNILEGISSSGFYMTHFNIGELDHAPSRESISYDDQTFFKVKTRVKKDVVSYLRDFEKQVGNLSGMSYYKFRRKFEGTQVYAAVKDIKFPFLDGNPLSYICPTIRGERSFIPKMFLLNEAKYGKIKGKVLSSGFEYRNAVFSASIHSFDQRRLFAIESPVILYSENEKGLYKTKETVNNASEILNKRDILVAESKEKAENILSWFGEGEVICGDKFSPEKVKRVSSGKGNSRGGYGVKEDWETIGKVFKLTETGYTTNFEKIDLSEEGVLFLPENNIEIKGIVKGTVTRLTMSNRIANVLKAKGINKVVQLNKNNSGKISRSGVEGVDSFLKKVVKEHKVEIIKSDLWADIHVPVYARDVPLLVKSKTNRTLKARQFKPCSLVQNICKISNFGLNSTKLYKKELNRKTELENKVVQEVEVIKEKLPLWDTVKHTQDKEKIEHYLRLEKVIK